MAKSIQRIHITYESVITINEDEMRALDALVGYGDDAFLSVFKEKLGSAYIRDHENGLKSFFKNIRNNVLPALKEVDKAREVLNLS